MQFSQIKHNIIWKSRGKQRYLIKRMYGFGIVLHPQVVVQYLPKASKVGTAFHGNACLKGSFQSTTANTLPTDGIALDDDGAEVTLLQPGITRTSHGIKIFLGSHLVVHPGNALIEYAVKTICTQIVVQFLKQRHSMSCRCLSIHYKSTIGKSRMRLKHVTFLVSRHEGIESAFLVKHQRIVLKTVAVIVHIISVEKERPVLRLGHKAVPFCLVFWSVSDNIKHLIGSVAGTHQSRRYTHPRQIVQRPAQDRRNPRRNPRACAIC